MTELSRTILLVEDDDDHAEIVEFHVHDIDPELHIHRLRDGAEAMAWIEASADAAELPWLVLLDLKLPCYDGHEVLSRLRASPRHRCLPVVVCSTSSARVDVERALLLGANAFVTKATDVGGFAELVAALLAFWRLSRHCKLEPKEASG